MYYDASKWQGCSDSDCEALQYSVVLNTWWRRRRFFCLLTSHVGLIHIQVCPNMGVPGLRYPFNPVTLEMMGSTLAKHQSVRLRGPHVSSGQSVQIPEQSMGIESQASRRDENYMSCDV